VAHVGGGGCISAEKPFRVEILLTGSAAWCHGHEEHALAGDKLPEPHVQFGIDLTHDALPGALSG
jgi:hypothetical protein